MKKLVRVVMKVKILGLLVLTVLFSGCATEILIPKNKIKTNFEKTRVGLPEKHLKIYVLPIVDLREDKTNFLGTHTIDGIGLLKRPMKSDISPTEIINEKLTDYFNSLGLFWVEKNKANAFLKLSLKKFQSNYSLHYFGKGLDDNRPGKRWSMSYQFIMDSEVKFDIEIIEAKEGTSIFKKTLNGKTDENDTSVKIDIYPNNMSSVHLGRAIQKAMIKIRPYELEGVAETLKPRFAKENRKQQNQPQVPSKQTPQSGSGSGFFVSKMGHVITNAHVVQNCKNITIGDNANKQVPAEVINTDRNNDLALLKLSSLEMASAESKSLIQKLNIAVVPLASKGLLRSEDVRLGEKVLVAGFPFGDVFSDTIKVTSGIVSATRGSGDDSGQFQLDAAVQPGNSGGPIYDSGGNIVGVVISQLDKLKMAKAIGSLPENVNFGIKASTVRQFLTSSGLPSKKSERTEEKSTEQLAEIAQNQALMVMCLQ
jgi:S1-C subfamily serine protease